MYGPKTKQGFGVQNKASQGLKLYFYYFFSGYSYICILFRAKKELLQWWTFLAHANFYVGSIYLVPIHVSPSRSLNLYSYFFGRLSPESIFYFCFRSNQVWSLIFTFTKLTISIYKNILLHFFLGGG